MNISYEYYRTFYYISKYKNLTTAAEVLHSNQPNLSRTIKLMEHELGCRLLIRSNRGISLTPEGEQLYSHVKIAIEQIQTAEEELKMINNLHKGVVTIGASETAMRLILQVLITFKKNHPDIHVRIHNHLTTQAITSVETGSVDFAVVASPANISKSLRTTTLMSFHDILIGGSAFAHLDGKSLSLSDLDCYPLVCLGEHTMTYQFYEHLYRSHSLLFRPELEAATTDQILPMVKSNLGLGFIPEIYALEALANGEVFQISLRETISDRAIYLVEKEERHLTVAAGALKDMLIASVSL